MADLQKPLMNEPQKMSDLQKQALNEPGSIAVNNERERHRPCIKCCCYNKCINKCRVKYPLCAVIFTQTMFVICMAFIGGILFHHFEYNTEKTAIQQKMEALYTVEHFLNTSNCSQEVMNSFYALSDLEGVPDSEDGNRWTFSKSIFFSFITASTIGYGFSAPVTDGGRLFTFIFGLPAICLFGFSMIQIGNAMVDRLDNKNKATLFQRWRQRCCKNMNYELSRFLFVLFQLLALILIGGIIIHKNQETGDWTFAEGPYFLWISMSTIGYGDLEPTLTNGKWIIVALIIWFGLVLVAVLIGAGQDYVEMRMKQYHSQYNIITKPPVNNSSNNNISNNININNDNINADHHDIVKGHGIFVLHDTNNMSTQKPPMSVRV